MGSLTAEAAAAQLPVGVHCLSPGMVLTPLLLEGASDSNKEVSADPSLAAPQPMVPHRSLCACGAGSAHAVPVYMSSQWTGDLHAYPVARSGSERTAHRA